MIKLYTLVTGTGWMGGMALVAAHSPEEAIALAKGNSNDDSSIMDYYGFCKPEEVPNCTYTGDVGVIRWDAHEG